MCQESFISNGLTILAYKLMYKHVMHIIGSDNDI